MSDTPTHPKSASLARRESQQTTQARVSERSASRKALRSADSASKRARSAQLLEQARKVLWAAGCLRACMLSPLAQVPMDVLASEWLDTTPANIETRRYLVEKLLPTLVLGLEKLLQDVERKGLVDQDTLSDQFNPINTLAQYLMRNNPRFSNFPEASPYMQSMRLVEQELKERAYELSGNRLARLSADVERRRRQVEAADSANIERWSAHLSPILEKFPQWDDSGVGLPVAPLRESLSSFGAHVKTTALFADLSAEVSESLAFPSIVVTLPDSELTVTQSKLTRFLGPIAECWPASLVESLARHLAAVFGSADALEAALFELYESIPTAVNRPRLQEALQTFYDDNIQNNDIILMRPRAPSIDACVLVSFLTVNTADIVWFAVQGGCRLPITRASRQ